MKIVAFDVDGTLRDYEDRLRHEVIDLLRWFLANTEATIVVWSGGGQQRAEQMVRTIGLDTNDRVKAMAKNDSLKPCIAIDDQDVTFGKVNINVCLPEYRDLDEIGGVPFGGVLSTGSNS